MTKGFNRPQTYLFVLTREISPLVRIPPTRFNRPQTYLFVLTTGLRKQKRRERLSFNRPQTYLFVLTGTFTLVRRIACDYVSIVLRRISSYSLRTGCPNSSGCRFRFNRPQTYLFVLTLTMRLKSDGSLIFVSIVLRRISSYSPRCPRYGFPWTIVSIVLRRISSYSPIDGGWAEEVDLSFNRPQTYLFVLTAPISTYLKSSCWNPSFAHPEFSTGRNLPESCQSLASI